MKITLIFLILLTSFTHNLYALEIIELSSQKVVPLSELLKEEVEGKTLVFGEFHYDKKILKAHAKLIWELVKRESLQGNFSTAWEFLEYDYNQDIQLAFNEWKQGKISDEDYLKRLFPKAKKPLMNLPYLDFMDATARLGGSLITTNATRQTKAILMEQGIGSLPAKDQPEHFLQGSSQYFERFRKVMGRHVPSHQLQQFFDAQVYTDNIIGTQIERKQKGQCTFLVIGSFHSDYHDGVVRYLKKNSSNDIVSFKIVNKNALTTDELRSFKEADPQYGYIADYLVIAE